MRLGSLSWRKPFVEGKGELCLGLGIPQVCLVQDPWKALGLQYSTEGIPSLQDQKEPRNLKGSAANVWKRVPGAQAQPWGSPGTSVPPPQKEQRLLPAPASLAVCMSAKMLLIKGISRVLLLGPGWSNIPYS